MAAVIAHLTANGASLRIDRDRIALYGGSGNVFRALPLVQDPKQTAIKSAVMYYGGAPVIEFRRDLPILFVRAALDRPPVNRAMNELVAWRPARTRRSRCSTIQAGTMRSRSLMISVKRGTRSIGRSSS